MRGRKALPSEIKLFKGNPGRRPLNPAEPKHPLVDDAVPEQLTGNDAAIAEWQRIVATLHATGHVTTVDRGTLIAYCETWALYRGLAQAAQAEPYVLQTSKGCTIPNPTIGMANRACNLLVKLAAELGITPSSRSRIVAIPNTPQTLAAQDAFAAYQRQRKG